jgi:LPXTG-site transpeptidase (sortase) family protein
VHHLSFHSLPSALPILKRKLPWIFLSVTLICFSVAGYLIWERYYNPFRLDFKIPPITASAQTYSLPVRITIPGLNLSLAVIPSQIIDNHWQTTGDGVSFLSASSRPGDSGNSIFYGHNWPRLLGNLYKLKTGQTIDILTSDGTTFTYLITEIKRVSPTDTSVLANTPLKQLTLYTCAGFGDTQRLVIKALVQTTKK